jgi:endonuclease V-like protein UPF0215 family
MYHNCFLGLDDGYFDIALKKHAHKGETYLVAVITCPWTVSDILVDLITVDGLEGTKKALEMIEYALSLYTINAVFLDGVTYAGFNIINPFKIFNVLGTPIITIFRHDLELDKVFMALKKHFNDHMYRYSVIEQVYALSREVFINDAKIRYTAIGIPINIAIYILKFLCRFYAYPYPLHVADKVASLLGRIKFMSFNK